MLEEIEEDLPIEPYTDPHVRELVAHLTEDDNKRPLSARGLSSGSTNGSGGGSGQGAMLEGAEEYTCYATSLRATVVTTAVEFINNPEARKWLGDNLPTMVQQSIQIISSSNNNGNGNNNTILQKSTQTQTAAALDLCYYIRLLPLIMSPLDLLSQLVPLLKQLIGAHMYKQGKILCTCIHILHIYTII